MAAPKQQQPPQQIDEDDEFEEFAQEQWVPRPEELKARDLWDHAWDDASLEDEIGKNLRAALPKVVNQPPQQQGQ